MRDAAPLTARDGPCPQTEPMLRSHGVPPDSTKPPRTPFAPPPLGARVIMTEMEEVGRSHRLERPRVAYRKNEKGEHVVRSSSQDGRGRRIECLQRRCHTEP